MSNCEGATVKDFNKSTGEILGHRDTIYKLLSKEKLNRRDITLASTILTRIGSPGQVTESDLQGVIGQPDPLATLISILRGKGDYASLSLADELQTCARGGCPPIR